MIDTDDDFSDQGWTGNGTEEDPYLISELIITTGSESIQIRNTRAYFVIENCIIVSHDSHYESAIKLQNVTHGLVRGCSVDAYGDGIEFDNVNESSILDNTVTNAGYAYLIKNSHWCSILNNNATGVNNTIYNWGYAFVIEYSSHCTISNNYAYRQPFSEFYRYSIGLRWSEYCNVTYNSIEDSDEIGIVLYLAHNCRIENNIIDGYRHVYSNTETGLYHHSSHNCIISGNKITECSDGMHIESSTNCTISENIVTDGSPDVWLESSSHCKFKDNMLSHSGVYVTGYSLSHWLHTMDNNTIDERPLGYFQNMTGMDIEGSLFAQVILANCSYVTLSDSQFQGAYYPILLGYSKDCLFQNNTISAPSISGFYLVHSDRCSLLDNNIDVRGTGIRLDYSDDCKLANNYLTDSNVYGFYIYGLHDCEIRNNLVTDIHWPFLVIYSHHCNLTQNRVFRGEYGIHLGHADYCIVSNNTVVDIATNGVSIQEGEYNQMYLNTLAFNGENNAKDDGQFNSWDNGVQGNYWDDYDGSGTYLVPGSAGIVDHYPNVVMNATPTIDHPPDLEFYENTSGHLITWHPSDEFPRQYLILKDGVVVESDSWDGLSISQSVDSLVSGSYNYTLIVEDYEGESVSDTVFVLVLENMTTTGITNTVSTTTTTTTTFTTTASTSGSDNTILFIASIAGVTFVALVLLTIR
ncbi:MAG: NosD domain-containing protein, partial [Candidatus Thorarchaeota archaeon]